jgi:hypothetical protein
MKEVKEKMAREQMRGNSASRYEAYKAKKLQRQLEEESRKTALANARIQSEIHAQVRRSFVVSAAQS